MKVMEVIEDMEKANKRFLPTIFMSSMSFMTFM